MFLKPKKVFLQCEKKNLQESEDEAIYTEELQDAPSFLGE